MKDFDDLTDLEDVFGLLRAPARSDELSHEDEMVKLMVNAHRTLEAKHMFTSRHARIATLVAAGILGFGGMAAASSPDPLEQALSEIGEPEIVDEPVVVEPAAEEEIVPLVEEPAAEEPVVAEPVVAEPVVVEEVVEAPAVEELPVAEEPVVGKPDPDETTEFNEAYCEDGNHGKTVSAVARGDFDVEKYEADNDTTLTVEMAAHSSCGKTGDDKIDDSDADEIDDSDADEIDDSEDVGEAPRAKSEKSEAKAERPGRSDRGAEKSANGKSNGNGKRDD
jgi:hypothetical protein